MERGLILKKGTIVDSTIISAPSSTKNKERKWDPDAHQVKKGNTWHFGYKAHIGVDRDSGLVHTVEATAANVHDATETSKLLTGDEDQVYPSRNSKEYCNKLFPKMRKQKRKAV